MLRNLYVSKRHLLTALKAQEAQTFYNFFAKEYLIMDWKIYTCGCFNNYLTTLKLDELDDYLQACLNKKQTHRLSRTLSVSAVVHLYSFSTKDQKNKRVVIRKYQTTRTQIERAKMYVPFSIFCPQCCRRA